MNRIHTAAILLVAACAVPALAQQRVSGRVLDSAVRLGVGPRHVLQGLSTKQRESP